MQVSHILHGYRSPSKIDTRRFANPATGFFEPHSVAAPLKKNSTPKASLRNIEFRQRLYECSSHITIKLADRAAFMAGRLDAAAGGDHLGCEHPRHESGITPDRRLCLQCDPTGGFVRRADLFCEAGISEWHQTGQIAVETQCLHLCIRRFHGVPVTVSPGHFLRDVGRCRANHGDCPDVDCNWCKILSKRNPPAHGVGRSDHCVCGDHDRDTA